MAQRVVCLGVDCFPRAILLKSGIIKSREAGYASKPFDLAYHPYETVCDLIETDFRDFFDGVSVDVKGIIRNALNGAIYNHDSPEGFRGRYENRIANFRESVSDPHPCVFVTRLPETQDDAKRLVSVLPCGSPLIAIRFSDRFPPIETRDGIVYVSRAPPENYVWYRDFETDAGRRFEEDISDLLRTVVTVRAST